MLPAPRYHFLEEAMDQLAGMPDLTDKRRVRAARTRAMAAMEAFADNVMGQVN